MNNFISVYDQRNNQLGSTHVTSTHTLYTFFIPLNHNDGRIMEQERLDRVENTILRYSDGLTWLSPGVGLWISRSGRLYRDRVIPVQVVVPTSSKTEEWAAYLTTEMLKIVVQHEIFGYAQPVSPVNSSSQDVPIVTTKSNGIDGM